MSESKAQIRQCIEQVFAESPYPTDDPVCECDCDECQSYIELFRDTHWRDHGEHTYISNWACLSFLTPSAFEFFFPGFILAELSDTERDGLPPWSALSHLRAQLQNAPNLFSEDQRNALRAILRWYENTYDSQWLSDMQLSPKQIRDTLRHRE